MDKKDKDKLDFLKAKNEENLESMERQAELGDKFSEKKHKRTKELINLRAKVSNELLDKKDDHATKRHQERKELLILKAR